MLEVKPLTNADHFTKPAHFVVAVGRDHAHQVSIPALVTISPTAAALSAAMQRQQINETKRDDDPKKSFRKIVRETLERLKNEM